MDRISICEGYWLYYVHWHASGLTRRCVMTKRGIAEQLHRMRFKPSPLLDLDSLRHEDRAEAREVYFGLVERYEDWARANPPDPCAAA